METLVSLISQDGFILGTFLPFVFVISLVVFIHEMGHYLVGRWCGIGAKAFSVGFGPEIVGFTDKRGTRWKFSLIPLGGYVKFYGDMNAASAGKADETDMSEEERAQSFHRKSVWRRAATVFAGPAANFIFTIAVLTIMFASFGRQIADPVVSDVLPGSAAEEAQLQKGDIIVSLDGEPVQTFSDIQRYVQPRANVEIQMVVRRDGQDVPLQITPRRQEIRDQFDNPIEHGVIGVQASREDASFRTVEYSPVAAIGEAFKESAYIVRRTAGYFANVVKGQESADQVGGPIRVAKIAGDMATLGIVPLLNLAAVLSLSIGLLNLLPVPILDGGHLLFYAYEAVVGRPVSERILEYGYRIGFALLISLMVFATWNDFRFILGG